MSKELLKEAVSHRNAMGVCSLLCIALSFAAPFISDKPLPDIIPIAAGILTVCWIMMIGVVIDLKKLHKND